MHRRFSAACAGAVLVSAVLIAQHSDTAELSLGKVLVASSKLGDPNFAESVILITSYDPGKGTMGLILTRPTDVPLSKAFPDIKPPNSDPVYMGGPVETTTAQALLRSRTKPEGAERIIEDVFVTGNKDTIDKAVRSGAEPSRFRLYVGYGGWSAGQLEHEIDLGAWHVLKASARIAFDDDPPSLWMRLSKAAEMRVARRGAPGYFNGEKSAAFANTESTCDTILPFASDSVLTFCHSGSALNSAQCFLASSRLGCARI